MFRKVVDSILIVFVEWAQETIIDELAVVEVIVDEARVDDQVQDYVQISESVCGYSASTSE